MSRYSQTDIGFWSNPKLEDLSFELRSLYHWTFTNDYHFGNLSGCYVISPKQIANELNLERDKVKELLNQLTELNLIEYSYETNELLILAFHKHQWNKSYKTLECVMNGLRDINSTKFRERQKSLLIDFITQCLKSVDTNSKNTSKLNSMLSELSEGASKGLRRGSVTVNGTVAVTDIENDTVNGNVAIYEKIGIENKIHSINELKDWVINVLNPVKEKVGIKELYPVEQFWEQNERKGWLDQNGLAIQNKKKWYLSACRNRQKMNLKENFKVNLEEVEVNDSDYDELPF